MLTAEYDLRYLAAGNAELENYLLSKDLYWPIQVAAPHGMPPYPQLTPGGLLLSLQRLQVTARSGAEQAELQKQAGKFNDILTQWLSAWTSKCRRDSGARLRLWGNFLNEYREGPAAHHDRYSYEVTRRVQIQLMAAYTGRLEGGEDALLLTMDTLLQSVLLPGAFLWDAPLEPAFPNPPFWYLYGKLKSNSIEE